MAFMFTRIVRNAIIAIIVYSVIQYLLRWKSYSISPKMFRKISAFSVAGSDGIWNFRKLRSDLRQSYPQHIMDSDWEAVYGGGLNLRINILYASLTEFIAVFHAPYRTAGFAGWHWMNSTCTVLHGEVLHTQLSGKNFRHGEFEKHSYDFAPDSYLACYGRGVVPFSSIWMGMGAVANGDPVSFIKLAYIYSNGCAHHVIHSLVKKFNHYESRTLKNEF
ncbi:unnamed protein product [Thelazia callipaeda]|uniref:Sigma non-opioid intracellular receptor 1 n=1 Tax=Thelazia callipaeda TaxID=103827 RepID=A0A0N5CN34_THECL|nr:unnamed protein product [Thelazia callipaeda]